MKDIIKSSALIGSTEFALIIVAIIRAKYLALNIGPEGYGEYSLLNSFFTILTAICGGWIARGTIKYTAEYRQKKEFDLAAKVHNYSISLALILGSIATALVFLFQSFVRSYFLSPDIILWHYSLFAASFLATSITPFFGWLLQSYLMIKRTVVLRIITSFFSLITVFIFVYFFELTGYFLSILCSAFFGLYLYWRETRRVLQTKFVLPNIKDEIFKKLMRFGSVNFVLLIINNISDYLQRVFVLGALNIASVGLFQVANSIINYMGILNRGSLFFNDPKMSQELTNDERNKVLNDFLRFNILLGIPISVILILFSKEFIILLYSESFVELSSILFVFVAAQFLSFLVGGFQSVMLGKSFLKMHSFISILYSVVVILIPFIFIRKFGLITIGLSILIANLITLIVDYTYLKNKIKISIHIQVFKLLVVAAFCFIVSQQIQTSYIVLRVLFLILVFLILIFSIKKEERYKLLALIKKSINRKI
ncbi:MAG: oligosaccharide flippase family protein [Paludibacter sp.]|nr:oligosaccharide flippase family protein [Paludibacter sp.]